MNVSFLLQGVSRRRVRWGWDKRRTRRTSKFRKHKNILMIVEIILLRPFCLCLLSHQGPPGLSGRPGAKVTDLKCPLYSYRSVELLNLCVWLVFRATLVNLEREERMDALDSQENLVSLENRSEWYYQSQRVLKKFLSIWLGSNAFELLFSLLYWRIKLQIFPLSEQTKWNQNISVGAPDLICGGIY